MQTLLDARRLVAVALNQPIEAVSASAAIGQLPAWDSIGHISIVLAVEGKIGQMLRPEQIGQLKSVGDIAAILESTGSLQAT